MSDNSAFVQPPVPGYSPYSVTQQDSPFQRTPGVQGLQEGVAGGQGFAFTPQQEFFASGTEGSAPPSSIAPGGAGMWDRFGGSGEAPSSLAQGQMQAQSSGMGSIGPQAPSMAATPAPMSTPAPSPAPMPAAAPAMAPTAIPAMSRGVGQSMASAPAAAAMGQAMGARV